MEETKDTGSFLWGNSQASVHAHSIYKSPRHLEKDILPRTRNRNSKQATSHPIDTQVCFDFLSRFEVWYIINVSCIVVFLLCSPIFGLSVFQSDQDGSVQGLAHLDICVLRPQKFLPRSGKTYWHACPCSRLMLRSLNGKQAITSRTKYVANDPKIFDAPA